MIGLNSPGVVRSSSLLSATADYPLVDSLPRCVEAILNLIGGNPAVFRLRRYLKTAKHRACFLAKQLTGTKGRDPASQWWSQYSPSAQQA